MISWAWLTIIGVMCESGPSLVKSLGTFAGASLGTRPDQRDNHTKICCIPVNFGICAEESRPIQGPKKSFPFQISSRDRGGTERFLEDLSLDIPRDIDLCYAVHSGEVPIWTGQDCPRDPMWGIVGSGLTPGSRPNGQTQ